MIGDYLFRINPREEQIIPLRQTFNSVEHSQTGVNNLEVDLWAREADSFLPAFVTVEVLAGAGQDITQVVVAIAPEGGGGAAGYLLIERGFAAGTRRFSRTITGLAPACIVQNGMHRLRLAASFSAAVLANTVFLSAGGMLVPRGNVSVGELVGAARGF